MKKRNCVFLVADKNMEAAFKGFLSRENFCKSLGCQEFDFDSNQDLIVASADNDPGLYTRGHEILRPYQNTHEFAIVVLDAEWDGSPGSQKIQEDMSNNIINSGWKTDKFKVIVIDPELEVWMWQKSEHVAKAFGITSAAELLKLDIVKNSLHQGSYKPDKPKEVIESILKEKRIPRSSAIYKKVTSKVSVKSCQDRSFNELRETLKKWFPEEN